MNSLQKLAAEYASHGLAVIPALPKSKEPAVEWKAFQYEPPSTAERNAMFSNERCSLNIAVVCGSASSNLATIDAETPRAFENQLHLCERAGLINTWIDQSPRGGGHIFLRFAKPIKPVPKQNDVEVRAQGQYVLMPPSVWRNGPIEAPYQALQRTSSILEVPSFDAVSWLKLEAAGPSPPYRSLPRTARQLLSGKGAKVYGSRSELEQAIVSSLVNNGFGFDEILRLFRLYKPGKFTELDLTDPRRAVEWLRRSFNRARSWCTQILPGRKLASELLSYGASIPWPGRTGSSDRAVYCAHAGLAYRSGKETYHASTRDLGELAGCDKMTASLATKRLIKKGLIQNKQNATCIFAAKYQLVKKTNTPPLPHNGFIGVVETSSFMLPEAFRQRGLGRSAYEVLIALALSPHTAKQIADKTGRHVQTVRGALQKLHKAGLVLKTKKMWVGRRVEDLDLDQLARTVGMKGALQHQREKHKADRLRHRMSVIRDDGVRVG